MSDMSEKICCKNCQIEIPEPDIRFSKKFFGRQPEFCEKCRREKEKKRNPAPLRELQGIWLISNFSELLKELNFETPKESFKENIFKLYSAGGCGYCGGGVSYLCKHIFHIQSSLVTFANESKFSYPTVATQETVLIRKMKKTLPETKKEFVYFVIEKPQEEDLQEIPVYKFKRVNNYHKHTFKGLGAQIGFKNLEEELNNTIEIAFYEDSVRSGRACGKSYFLLYQEEEKQEEKI